MTDLLVLYNGFLCNKIIVLHYSTYQKMEKGESQGILICALFIWQYSFIRNTWRNPFSGKSAQLNCRLVELETVVLYNILESF